MDEKDVRIGELHANNLNIGWHSPDNIMPAMKKKVLVYTDKGEMFIGCWTIKGNSVVWNDVIQDDYLSLARIDNNVLYWRSLPIEPTTFYGMAKEFNTKLKGEQK